MTEILLNNKILLSLAARYAKSRKRRSDQTKRIFYFNFLFRFSTGVAILPGQTGKLPLFQVSGPALRQNRLSLLASGKATCPRSLNSTSL